MSISFARANYQKTERSGVQEVTDPHEIIFVTLRELEKSIRTLSISRISQQPYSDRQLTRALTAVYILQTSLDFEKGGEVADSLFRVYEYCRMQLMMAFRRDPTAALDAAADAISGLADAWMQIAPTKKSAA